MSFSTTNRAEAACAVDAQVSDDELIVSLVDGRTLRVPVAWYPRLMHGSGDERADFQLIGRGEGIHWPLLDEDIAIDDLLAGRSSGESEGSLRRWLASRDRN